MPCEFIIGTNWQDCSTCLNTKSGIYYNDITIDQLRTSADAGCSFCSFLLTGLSLFELDSPPVMPLLIHLSEYGPAICPGGNWWTMGKGTQRLLFEFPKHKIHLPITSLTVERHFIEYSDHESMQRVAHLIDECNDQHDCLQKESPKLPKRVINVGNNSTNALTLYCPAAEERAQYTILSHCWGGISPFVTLDNNLEARRQGFDISELPKTFRDAVIFTRNLGIRYLWIDSVCIIQGNKKDWSSEAQKMADYYTNAFITIAASRAVNGCSGFLHLTDRRRKITIYCQSGEVQFDCIISDTSFEASSCEIGNPLYYRGWAFQEMLLSQRIISFGSKELEWYCRRHNWCECSYLVANNVFMGAHSPHWQYSRDGIVTADYQEWMNIVREFTRRNLTFASDRLPALSGLARRVDMTLNAPYLAGIWKTDPFVWEALKWISATRSGSLLPMPRAPSWSWASIDGKILYDGVISGCDGVELLGAEVQLSGSNIYGEVNGGFLRVRGALLKVQLDIKPKILGTTWREGSSQTWKVLSTSGKGIERGRGDYQRGYIE